MQRHRVTSLPPAAASMLLGVGAGIVVRATGLAAPLRFSPAAFFYGLLPPIVFAAGFTLRKRDFFRNIGTITLFAVGGTILSTLVLGLSTYLLVLLHIVQRKHLGPRPFIECMLYGALLSATDTVATLSVFGSVDAPPLLYSLVFGESVLNDAAAIVLFRTLVEFYSAPATWTTPLRVAVRFGVVLGGSTMTGLLVALGCAFVLKRFELAPDAGVTVSEDGGGGGGDGGPRAQTRRSGGAAASPARARGTLAFAGPEVYEICLVVMGAYLAYLVAEVLALSGIVALFAAGIAHAHYSSHAVSPDARVTLARAFETAAFLCETFVFAYLGLQVASLFARPVDWGLLLSVVPLCVVARVSAVLPLARLANAHRALPLPSSVVNMLAAAGLRGAVAYGLAVNLPQIESEAADGIPAVEAATLVAVVASTLLAGPAVPAALDALGLTGASDADLAVAGLVEVRGLAPGAAADRAADVVASGGATAVLAERFADLDDRVFKPLFGGRPGGPGGRATGLDGSGRAASVPLVEGGVAPLYVPPDV